VKRRKLEPIIIETSLDLFRKKGFDEVSVMDICEACDITKPTFYKYAASKGELLNFFFTRLPKDLDENWDDLSKYDCVWNCVSSTLQQLLQNFMAYGIDLCTQLYIQNIETEYDTFKVPADFKNKLIDVIEKGKKEHEFANTSSAAQLADLSLTSLIGYGAYWVLYNGEKDVVEDYLTSLKIILFCKEKEDEDEPQG
jgi:AcrR family transcriptional regulator